MSYDFDYYSGNHLKYPTKPIKPTISRNPSALVARAWAEALEEYERELEKFEEDRSYYTSENSRLLKEFTEKLQKDYEISDAQFRVLWNEAYDRGHSAGLEEVFSYFDTLYNLVTSYMSVSTHKG
jgi:hypothetical protein